MPTVLFFIIYQLLQILALPFVILYLLSRVGKKALFGNLKERLGLVPKSPKGKNIVWIHAVSVGEVLSIEHLINQIKQHSVVVLVEQNFYMASSVGDHFYILDDGKVVHSGAMETLVKDEEMQSKYLGISKAD